ncbi:hypothetical protein KASIA_p016 [Shewanella phage vB_SspS_KASIA]|nr:hypothetical protein KASIA_p016 [Shewanella phage vB_SspS_KASIA]
MKLVTNKVPVITNGMYPMIDMQKGTADWSKVIMAESGTVFKVKAIMMNQVYLENNKYSLWVDASSFREFFTEHELEV